MSTYARRIWLPMVAAAAIALVGGLPASAQQEASVEVADDEFVPDRIEVDAGTTVVWTQTGENPHTVTADDGSFDSSATCPPNFMDCMQEGDTFEHTFDQPGEFAYYCKLHGAEGGRGMSGVVVVREAARPQPAPEQPQPAPEPPPPSQPAPEPSTMPPPAADQTATPATLAATGSSVPPARLAVLATALLVAGLAIRRMGADASAGRPSGQFWRE